MDKKDKKDKRGGGVGVSFLSFSSHAIYEKVHPDMALCFKRIDGSVVLIVFQDDTRTDWLLTR